MKNVRGSLIFLMDLQLFLKRKSGKNIRRKIMNDEFWKEHLGIQPNKKSIRDMIVEYNPDAIIFDDLDDAIIGVGQQHGSQTVVIYDRQKCIDIFQEKFAECGEDQFDRELTEDEELDTMSSAIEWFEHNVECAYVGKNTPIFIEKFENEM